MPVFSSNFRCFSYIKSVVSLTVIRKKPASFYNHVISRFYFFYFFYFQQFHKSVYRSFTEMSGVPSRKAAICVFNLCGFLHGVFGTCGSIYRAVSSSSYSSSFLTKIRDVSSVGLQSSWSSTFLFVFFPLYVYLVFFFKVRGLLLSRSFAPSSIFDSAVLSVVPGFSGVFHSLFVQNVRLIWDLLFLSFGQVHAYFTCKAFALFNLLYYPGSSVYSYKRPLNFWHYFRMFLIFSFPSRFCSLRKVTSSLDTKLLQSFLFLYGSSSIRNSNAVIFHAFYSPAFLDTRFFLIFDFTKHFAWVLTSFYKQGIGLLWKSKRKSKSKAKSRKLVLFRVKRSLDFVRSSLFQFLSSIQKRGLKLRAFNFIFSFFMLLCFEKSENLELFSQENIISYKFSTLFFQLRLPFQVYNTRVRGKNVQLPVLLPRSKSMVLAFKLFIMSVKKRDEWGLLSKLFGEFFELIQEGGLALKQKSVTFRLAFSNKNLLFFRATKFTFGQQRRKKVVIL